MTVASETSSVAYAGTGATNGFPVPFLFYLASDLVVTVDAVPLTEGVDYTVDGLGSPGGGTVYITAAPALDAEVLIVRTVPLTQAADFINQGAVMPETFEQQLDRTVMMAQQVKRIATAATATAQAAQSVAAATAATVATFDDRLVGAEADAAAAVGQADTAAASAAASVATAVAASVAALAATHTAVAAGYSGSWTSHATYPAGYSRAADGKVTLRGAVTVTPYGSEYVHAAFLPSDCRPALTRRFLLPAHKTTDTSALLLVDPDGTLRVLPVVAGDSFFSYTIDAWLDGVSFYPAGA